VLVVSFCGGQYRQKKLSNATVLIVRFWEWKYSVELIMNVIVFIVGSGECNM